MPIQLNRGSEPLSQPYQLANDSEMRLLLGYSAPPRAGQIQALNGGVYTVEIADSEDATVQAIAVNGYVYRVGSVVYVLQESNAPDSGVIVGCEGYAKQLSIGAANPDGPLHVENDIGAFAVVSARDIDAAERTLISDRIARALTGDVMAVEGTSIATLALMLGVPGASYNAQNLTVSSTTLQFRLYSNGELRVVRTSGTGTPDVIVRALWM